MAGRDCPNCDETDALFAHGDGSFYCKFCNHKAEDIFEIGIDDDQFYSKFHRRLSRVDDSGVGPTEPSDFGSFHKNLTYEEYYSEIRIRYLKGLQIMIQLQSRALIHKFNVSPLIIGLVGPVWLRVLASTGILLDEWADRAVHDSEAQKQGEPKEFKASANYSNEPVNIHGKRLVYIRYRSLRSTLPISFSLAISFLVCHLAREPILPSDMLKWTIEGKLPYFAAFGDIEQQLGPPSGACPISASRMFRPIQAVSSHKLESMAADFAQRIGLVLPPVNFNAIACRYLRQLSLPIGTLLPLSCHICEWSNPPELCLSANESRLPSRACVMSILILAIRILFNINGYGMWESSRNEDTELQSHYDTTQNADENLFPPNSEPSDSKSSVMKLLKILEAKYYELDDGYEYSCDLASYLQYCKDVVFSGLRPPYNDGEEKLAEECWEFYQKNKGPGTSDKNEGSRDVSERRKRSDEDGTCNTSKKSEDDSKCRLDQDECCVHDQDSANGKRTSKEEAIKKLKLDMNENQFCYIPPRVKVKNKDYIHYTRRRKDAYIYAVHADYYILLRCCSKIAQVEPRIMHIAVLSLERRLQWLEKRMESSLHFKPSLEDLCKLCEDKFVVNAGDDHVNSYI